MRRNSICESGWWVVLLTMTLNSGAFSESSVGVYNMILKQVITSSTLKWATLPKEPVMDNIVPGAESADGKNTTKL